MNDMVDYMENVIYQISVNQISYDLIMIKCEYYHSNASTRIFIMSINSDIIHKIQENNNNSIIYYHNILPISLNNFLMISVENSNVQFGANPNYFKITL